MKIRDIDYQDFDVTKATPEMVQQYMKMFGEMLMKMPGNAPEYAVAAAAENPDSPLKGKRIIFLGSSVMAGTMAMNESFCDYLQKEDGIIMYKEALAGTSMVDKDQMGPSYIKRMRTIPADFAPDLFVCQLSTNDFTQKMPLGRPAERKDPADFDVMTIAGAIEYIIAYAKETWNCPVMFYTGTRFNGELYQQMVDLLLELKEKWNIEVADLWNEIDLSTVDDADYDLYMADPIHPTKAGYRLWWAPFFRQKLTEFFAR